MGGRLASIKTARDKVAKRLAKIMEEFAEFERRDIKFREDLKFRKQKLKKLQEKAGKDFAKVEVCKN